MSKRDYYEVLGVSRTASDQELKRAYRALAQRYHPDKNQTDPTAEDKFKELGEAYSVLADPDQQELRAWIRGRDTPGRTVLPLGHREEVQLDVQAVTAGDVDALNVDLELPGQENREQPIATEILTQSRISRSVLLPSPCGCLARSARVQDPVGLHVTVHRIGPCDELPVHLPHRHNRVRRRWWRWRGVGE